MGANKSVLLDSVSVVGPSLTVPQHAHSSMDIDRPVEQGFTSKGSTHHGSATPGGSSSFRATVSTSISNGAALAATPIFKDGNLMQPAPTLGQVLITLGQQLPDGGQVSTAYRQLGATATAKASVGWDGESSNNQGPAGSAMQLRSSCRNTGETVANQCVGCEHRGHQMHASLVGVWFLP